MHDFYIFERLSRMHENNIFLLLFSIYFFYNISEKIRYFSTGFVSYSVKIQTIIKQKR